MISAGREKSGLTSLDGSTFGPLRAATRFTCRPEGSFRRQRTARPTIFVVDRAHSVLAVHNQCALPRVMRYTKSVFVNAFRDRFLVNAVLLSARAWRHLPDCLSDRG